jgi:hypothetical protein
VRDANAGKGSGELGDNIGGGFTPCDAALPGVGQCHSGIEMRSRDRAECEDDRHQCGTGGDGVGQQSDGDVAACEPLSHDS